MFNSIIKTVEDKWLKILFDKTRAEFLKNPIPSHDESHHLRVWNSAKEIIYLLSVQGYKFSFNDIEKIIIAVFFHDTGLTITQSADHGAMSRKICENFIYSFSAELETEEIFKAIENHDDKKYLNIKSEDLNTVYTILTTSDDLDAYGAIGVYRYLEIYFMREIPVNYIPEKVCKNLIDRFNYFENKFYSCREFVMKHRERQQFTYNFFYNYDNKVNSEIINFLIKHIIKKKKNIEKVFEEKNFDVLLSSEYFQQLKKELGI